MITFISHLVSYGRQLLVNIFHSQSGSMSRPPILLSHHPASVSRLVARPLKRWFLFPVHVCQWVSSPHMVLTSGHPTSANTVPQTNPKIPKQIKHTSCPRPLSYFTYFWYWKKLNYGAFPFTYNSHFVKYFIVSYLPNTSAPSHYHILYRSLLSTLSFVNNIFSPREMSHEECLDGWLCQALSI